MSSDRFSFDLPSEGESPELVDPAPVTHKGSLPDLPGDKRVWPVNLDLHLPWSDADIVERLEKAIDPSKTYRARMPDPDVWFQTTGERWLILAHAARVHSIEDAVREIKGFDSLVIASAAEPAVKSLFGWVAQFLSLKEPLLLNEYIERLVFPPVGDDEPYWDGSEDIITL